MDKFLTFEGEMPIWLNDFDFIDKSVRDTFDRLVKSFTDGVMNDVILSGCVFTAKSGMVSWTSGVVALGGEILPLESGSMSGSIGDMYFTIANLYDSGGSRTFKNGTPHNCWNIRKAAVTTTPGDHKVSHLKTLDYYLKLDRTYSVAGFSSSGNRLRLIKGKGGGLYLQGDIAALLPNLVSGAKVNDLSITEASGYLGKHTYTTGYYKRQDGELATFLADIYMYSDSNDVLLDITISGSPVLSTEGQIYCRLFDM